MKNFCASLTFITFFCLPLVAQNNLNHVSKKQSVPTTSVADTLKPSPLFLYYFGDMETWIHDDYVMSRVKPSMEFSRLYLPLTYYNSPIGRITNFERRIPHPEELLEPELPKLPYDTTLYTRNEIIKEMIDRTLLDTYLEYPKLVTNYEDYIMSIPVYKEKDYVEREPAKTPILRLFTPDKPEERVVEPELVINKPNFWLTGGNGSFQMSQNSISDNWYQGGESMNNLMANIKLFANYNDKNKLQFESYLEAKAGFNTVSGDTYRKYRVNTDLLRLYTKLGIQAASKWFYTVSAEFNTQFFNNYTANSNDMVSSFLAPANLIFSVGMDYKLKNNKIDLSVFISPLAYNFRYVGNDKVDETKFGLDPGKKVLHDFGSKFQTNLSWTIIPSISYQTRLYYFTNYEKVEAEWENTINFVLNRYLSTKLFVHTRFDDGINRVEGHSYFQVKQYLSFGINYNW